ncbi:MAG: Holliday junction resolvase RuvX [Psychroflexus sp.]|jgi:putative Holliday junction resolvase|nr:Holliday junction resolvase RuvX [Psychroflexus sp.]MDR9448806.1 Holliday junction resolvase RuvX [Psychroflexus sp.]
MARALAIDFGLKRCGIAVSDDMKMIASGLTTVDAKDLMEFLNGYFLKEQVDEIIIGLPKHKDGQVNAIEKNIQFLIKDLASKFPDKTLKRVDERFTSKMAFQSMIDSGIGQKKRRDKKLVDEISATIILQSYLY